MANEFGNQYRIAIGEETSYGSGCTQMSGANPAVGSVDWDDLLVHSGVINMTPTINTAQRRYKADWPYRTPVKKCRLPRWEPLPFLATHLLTSSKNILVEWWLILLSAQDFRFPADCNRYPFFCAVSDLGWCSLWNEIKFNRVNGAKLQQLVITGSQGGLIQFEATFGTQTVEREVQQDITGLDPGRKSEHRFSLSEVVATLAMGNDAAALNTFSITFTNEFTADASKFANNMTLFNPHIIKQGGEISYTCNYDSAGAETDLSIISDPKTINGDEINI